MGIPKTYDDRNPEDRNWISDVWEWLQTQPQAAWLYFVRNANFDDMDWLFPQMVRHPDCDRALASWLFWMNEPGAWLEGDESPVGAMFGDLMTAILERADAGGWSKRDLHYPRVEVAYEAVRAAKALATRDGPPVFLIPRELCASFEGANPPLVLDDETLADWQELGEKEYVSIALTDEEAIRRNRDGGNWWFEPALRLPEDPVVTSDMSDVEAIEAIFGEWESTDTRIERARDLGNRAQEERLNADPERSAELYRLNRLSQERNEQAWPAERAASHAATAPEQGPKRSFVGRLAAYLLLGCAALIGALHFFGAKAAIVVLIVWLLIAWWI